LDRMSGRYLQMSSMKRSIATQILSLTVGFMMSGSDCPHLHLKCFRTLACVKNRQSPTHGQIGSDPAHQICRCLPYPHQLGRWDMPFLCNEQANLVDVGTFALWQLVKVHIFGIRP
jgi:hypothetical protein